MSENNPLLLCHQCGREMAADKASFPTLGGKGVIMYTCTCGQRKLLNTSKLSAAEIEEMNEHVRSRFGDK